MSAYNSLSKDQKRIASLIVEINKFLVKLSINDDKIEEAAVTFIGKLLELNQRVIDADKKGNT